jgi:hypothetical protein
MNDSIGSREFPISAEEFLVIRALESIYAPDNGRSIYGREWWLEFVIPRNESHVV